MQMLPSRQALVWLFIGLCVGQLPYLLGPQAGKTDTNIVYDAKADRPTDISFKDIVDSVVDVDRLANIFSSFSEEYYQLLDKYCAGLFYFAEAKMVNLLKQPNAPVEIPPLAEINCENPEYAWVLTGKKREKRARLFDMFLMNSELDMLEVRFHELYGAIDSFVLLESTFNHRWSNKPLFYARSKEYYKKFWDSVLHIVYDDSDIKYAARTTTKAPNRQADFTLELLNRRMLISGLRHAYPKQEGDMIMISDIDEIPDRNLLNHLRHCVPKDMPVKLQTTFHLITFNMTRQRAWTFPTIGLDEHYFRTDWNVDEPSWFRFERPISLVAPKSVGWHLNRFALPEFTLLKELSMSETTPIPAQRLRDPESWSVSVANYPSSDVISGVSHGVATNLPWFIQANPNKYPHFFAEYWKKLASKYK